MVVHGQQERHEPTGCWYVPRRAEHGGLVEQQVDHDHPGGDGQVDRQWSRGPPVEVPQQQVQRSAGGGKERGRSDAGGEAHGDGSQVAGGRVARYRETDANPESGGAPEEHDEQVHGTCGAGETLGCAYEASSIDRHDVTMTWHLGWHIRLQARVLPAIWTAGVGTFG
jgi:hypothetical protein